ncbi:MAG: response regulator, partial [Proteobacteria bacterium]|nr:response regulator [Pseudomonadota bacterium]
VLKASYRARDLVKQILSFSRQSDREKKPVDIAMIIKESVKLLRASIPSTIDITVDIHREPLLTIGDPTQMHQVIMNLCTNARHAMGDLPGQLTITAGYVSSLSQTERLTSGLSEGPYIRLVVADTGCGMPANVLDRMFEPYFTTKPKGEGTGLGLSVIHRIITNNGGAISVKSIPGKGTSFLIFLPFHDSFEMAVSSEKKDLMTGNERVLFVDDETTLVEMGNKILQRLGYQTRVTDSPEEALKIFKADPDRFDLLISDMTMPKITGERLAIECHKIRPQLPVIICTGFSESIKPERAKAANINAVLLKPLLIEDLAQAIRQVLDSKI